MKHVVFASLFSLYLSCLLLAVPSFSVAVDKPEVRTGAQPCLHGLPLWHAEKAGLLKNAPFKNVFMLFASARRRPKPWPPANGIWAPWARCPP